MNRFQFLTTLLSPLLAPFIKREERVIYKVNFVEEEGETFYGSDLLWFMAKLEREGADWIPGDSPYDLKGLDFWLRWYNREQGDWVPYIDISRVEYMSYDTELNPIDAVKYIIKFVGPDGKEFRHNLEVFNLDPHGYHLYRSGILENIRKDILEHYKNVSDSMTLQV